ncbi:response regulator transcription factor [Povalibacter sp.]|uniref:response regulator transcription factor n=1 Tax=Povalibacter sp. TaxID=1962978 RepID=UPI002F3F4805
MTKPEGTVYVVDDDPGVRESMEDLLSSHGFAVTTFSSAADYKAAVASADGPACLVLDIDLPDMSGLELQSELAGHQHPPIVFITGYGDIPSSVRAIKAGAVDFLPKPFTSKQLLTAIDAALLQHREMHSQLVELASLRVRYASLTPREREVLPLVVRGRLNKQAAAELGIREVTLQIHRAHIMRKMDADSLPDLVRMSMKLGIASTASEGQSTSQLRSSAAGEGRSGTDPT